MRVLVTGASGNVGGATLQSLVDRGVPAVAATRSGRAVSPDAPGVALDFGDPDTWGGALQGVDRLLLVRPPAISDVGPTLNAFLDRAQAQLKRVVFLSVAGAEQRRFIPHAKVEDHLMAGPVPWTFLRAGFFAQNLCGPYRQDIQEDDRLYAPAGQQPVSWVDTRDLGEAAAIALTDPSAEGQAWTLTGGEALTFAEVAEQLSAQLGRPVRYEAAGLPGYLWHLRRRRGLPWGPSLVYAALHTAIRFGAEARVDPTLGEVLGREPRRIEDCVRDHLALWRR